MTNPDYTPEELETVETIALHELGRFEEAFNDGGSFEVISDLVAERLGVTQAQLESDEEAGNRLCAETERLFFGAVVQQLGGFIFTPAQLRILVNALGERINEEEELKVDNSWWAESYEGVRTDAGIAPFDFETANATLAELQAELVRQEA